MKVNGYSAIGAIVAVLLLGACAQTDMDAMRADVTRNSQAIQQIQQDQTAMRNEIRAAAQGAQQAAQSAQAAANQAQGHQKSRMGGPRQGDGGQSGRCMR